MTAAPDPDPQAPGLTRDQLLTLAHELRGALTVIAGYSDILRRPLEPSARDMATEGIARAVQRADHLLEDALAENGIPALRIERLDLRRLVEAVVDEQRVATGRSIQLRVDASPMVEGDEDALSRLLGNLIDNAAKYSPDGSAVDVNVQAGTGVASVTVLDRGPGIAREHRVAAFTPYERLGAGDEVRGTGIGLAVVAQIATAHGGIVTIGDRPGGGTTVTLELPVV